MSHRDHNDCVHRPIIGQDSDSARHRQLNYSNKIYDLSTTINSSSSNHLLPTSCRRCSSMMMMMMTTMMTMMIYSHRMVIQNIVADGILVVLVDDQTD
jgi:hypothetical protein